MKRNSDPDVPHAAKEVPRMERARLAVGLTLEQAAKRAHIKPASLRRMELGTNTLGGCSYEMANRLQRIYGCEWDVFAGSQRQTPPRVKSVRKSKREEGA